MSQRFMRDPFGIQEGRMRMQNRPAAMPIGTFLLRQVGFIRRATVNNARLALSGSAQAALAEQKHREFAF